MKHTLKKISVLVCCLLTASMAMAQTRIMVISDPHVLAKANETSASTLTGKLDKYSYEILSKATEDIKLAKPDLLLVCGDLTYNGEATSHLSAYDLLSNVKNAGIPVMVIPGNHDILNINSIDPENANITATAFAERYKDMGYGSNVVRDENTLSWAASVNDKLAIIGLDANIYDGTNYYSDGCLRKSTLDWMKTQAANFQSQGKMVIAMVHQQLIDRYMGYQAMQASSTLLNITYKRNPVNGTSEEEVTNADVQKAFADAGIHYILTGHMHIHNIATSVVKTSAGNDFTLTDISTGGLTTYPCWMRTLRVDETSGTITSTSTMVEMPMTENNTKMDLQTLAAKYSGALDTTYPFIYAATHKTVAQNIKAQMLTEPYELYDATEVSQFTTNDGTTTQTAYTFPSLKYTRTFSNTSWQALFVPFASVYSDWSENFDIATPDAATADYVHFTRITDPATSVPANTVALIKAKSTGTYTITSSVKSNGYVTLVPDVTTNVLSLDYNNDYSNDFSLQGEYSGLTGKWMHDNEVYALGGGLLKSVGNEASDSEEIFLKPMRWYLSVLGNSGAKPSSIQFRIDDDIVNAIDVINGTAYGSSKIYRIDGTQVQDSRNLPHGLYIINKKVVAK